MYEFKLNVEKGMEISNFVCISYSKIALDCMLNPLLPTYVFQFILSYINFYSNFIQKKKKLTAAFFTDLLQNPDKVFFRQTLDKNEDSVM